MKNNLFLKLLIIVSLISISISIPNRYRIRLSRSARLLVRRENIPKQQPISGKSKGGVPQKMLPETIPAEYEEGVGGSKEPNGKIGSKVSKSGTVSQNVDPNKASEEVPSEDVGNDNEESDGQEYDNKGNADSEGEGVADSEGQDDSGGADSGEKGAVDSEGQDDSGGADTGEEGAADSEEQADTGGADSGEKGAVDSEGQDDSGDADSGEEGAADSGGEGEGGTERPAEEETKEEEEENKSEYYAEEPEKESGAKSAPGAKPPKNLNSGDDGSEEIPAKPSSEKKGKGRAPPTFKPEPPKGNPGPVKGGSGPPKGNPAPVKGGSGPAEENLEPGEPKTRPVGPEVDRSKLVEICDKPVLINSANRYLNSTVRLFRENSYWDLMGLPDTVGFTSDKMTLIPPMAPIRVKASVVTVLEGHEKLKGRTFKFEGKKFWKWNDSGIQESGGRGGEFWEDIPEGGFDTMFHNGDSAKPMIIAFKEDLVYYLSTKEEDLQFIDTDGKLGGKFKENYPVGVTSVFTWPMNTGLKAYFFRGEEYCVRDAGASQSGKDCEEWKQSVELFGCIPPTTEPPPPPPPTVPPPPPPTVPPPPPPPPPPPTKPPTKPTEPPPPPKPQPAESGSIVVTLNWFVSLVVSTSIIFTIVFN